MTPFHESIPTSFIDASGRSWIAISRPAVTPWAWQHCYERRTTFRIQAARGPHLAANEAMPISSHDCSSRAGGPRSRLSWMCVRSAGRRRRGLSRGCRAGSRTFHLRAGLTAGRARHYLRSRQPDQGARNHSRRHAALRSPAACSRRACEGLVAGVCRRRSIPTPGGRESRCGCCWITPPVSPGTCVSSSRQTIALR